VLFRTNRWLEGYSVATLAPDLLAAVRAHNSTDAVQNAIRTSAKCVSMLGFMCKCKRVSMSSQSLIGIQL
jgi:hypothetical protein